MKSNIFFFSLSGVYHRIFIFTGILLIIGLFFHLGDEKKDRWWRVITYSYMTLYFAKSFFFKNYFEWNKKGAVLKLNKRFGIGKTINYSKVDSYSLSDETLKFEQKNGSLAFDISEIDARDISKLNNILPQNIA